MSGLVNTKRIEYIDSLRGFTMVLVVLNHVAAYSLGINTAQGSIHFYLMQFRMPLFFFISGFLLYKKGFIWSWENSFMFIKKKIFVQIISPLLFYLIYIYINDKSFLETICHPFKAGFWFTYTLFEYYLFYILCQRFLMLFKNNEKYFDIILLMFGVGLYVLTATRLSLILPISSKVEGLLGVIQWKYFLFFVFGVLIKRNFSSFLRILDKNWFIPLCVVLYSMLNIFSSYTIYPGINMLSTITTSLCGIIIVFAFFRKNERIFSIENKLGKVLRFIGKRTLDIYLLHIFVLPRNLMTYFDNTLLVEFPLIEIVVSFILTIIVILACLAISSVLRLSPLMAHYLFGQKVEPSNKY